MKAIKSVKQKYTPDQTILNFLETFRYMVNHCIRIGLQNNVHTLKRLSLLSYHELEQYDDIPSYYKLCAISKAAGMLSNRDQSVKRGINTKKPYLKKPILISCYGFKLEENVLRIPLGGRQYFEIPLNYHTKDMLSSHENNSTFKINSFVLTADHISISYSKDVPEIQCKSTAGIDRNLRNITVGNCNQVAQYDISKAAKIAQCTKSITSSFKRNDHRIRKRLYSKYGTRRKNRVNQMLHHVSKDIVQNAVQNKHALVFEDIRHIRKMYQKGNWQGRKHRGTMNGWSFSEIKRQIEYKSRWSGTPVIQLSKKETRGTSTLCPRCGKRLQEQRVSRELWCEYCKRWLDRDVIAVMNQSLRGLPRLGSSKGDAGEAMKGNADSALPLILRVDASKLQLSGCHPIT
ncbi:MAG: RNA-guided endonuclease InsQ/TnpB family protein [Nitrosotalea sp.]